MKIDLPSATCGDAATTGVLSVVVIEDHPLYRFALEQAIAAADGIDLVSSCATAADGLAAIRATRPSVVTLDLGLPETDGFRVLATIEQERLDARVLVLSARQDEAAVYRALEAGANGYLFKSVDAASIECAIRLVAANEAVLPRNVEARLIGAIRSRRQPVPELSSREREVLALIADGHSAQDAARTLFVSTATVKAHLRSIYEKLGVSDRASAVARAIRAGILE